MPPKARLRLQMLIPTLGLVLLLATATAGAQGAADHLNSGRELIQQGEYARAADEFGQAIALAPEDPQAYRERAYAYVKLGRPDAAVADADRALLLRPADPAPYHAIRGHALAGLSLHQAALAALNQALADDPHLAEAYFYRAGVYLATGRWKAALTDYGQYIILHGDNGASPELEEARRRCVEITRALPELRSQDKRQVAAALAYNFAARPAADRPLYDWRPVARGLSFRYILQADDNARPTITVDNVERFGDHTLVVLKATGIDVTDSRCGYYTLAIFLVPLPPGNYIVELVGVKSRGRNGPPKATPLIAVW